MKLETQKIKPDSRFMFQDSHLGFTLIELLVVVFITVTISTISIANFRQGEKRKQVAIAADIVTNSLRNAQNFSLSGKKTNNANPACRTPVNYFVTWTYPGDNFPLYAFSNCSSNDFVENYFLPANTKIRANGFSLNGVSGSINLTLVFDPPFGRMTASMDNAAYVSFTTASLTIESLDGSVARTVTIDGVAGRIGE